MTSSLVTRQEVLVKRDDGGGQYFAKDYLFRKQDNGQDKTPGRRGRMARRRGPFMTPEKCTFF